MGIRFTIRNYPMPGYLAVYFAHYIPSPSSSSGKIQLDVTERRVHCPFKGAEAKVMIFTLEITSIHPPLPLYKHTSISIAYYTATCIVIVIIDVLSH